MSNQGWKVHVPGQGEPCLVHDTLEGAQEEAQRLANKLHKKTFIYAVEAAIVPLAPVGTRIVEWLTGDDTGLSSKSMVRAYKGLPPVRENYSYPHDPSDFGRCYRLLKDIPEVQKGFPKLAQTSGIWNRYINRWGDLVDLHVQEYKTGKPCGLYELMQKLQKFMISP